MTDSLKDVIKRLEQQGIAIERALAALREVDGTGVESEPDAPATATPARRKGAGKAARKAARKGGMTPEGRKRLSEALRKRWAAKKAAEGSAPATQSSTRKSGMTPEGRKRLSEALRKRWAAKRAGSGGTAKRAVRK